METLFIPPVHHCARRWVTKIGNIQGHVYSAADYEYVIKKDCRCHTLQPVAQIHGYKRGLPARDEEALKEAVKIQPVTAVMAVARILDYKNNVNSLVSFFFPHF